MPTYLKLIVMLGEVIGCIIFSFIRCRNYYKIYTEIYKKDWENKNGKTELKAVIIYYSICVSILLFLFVFSFPSYIFLSYNKLIVITTIIILTVMPFVMNSKADFFNKYPSILFMTCLGWCMALVFVLAGTIIGFFNCKQCIQFKKCINEEKEVEIIYPVMNLTEKSKIGYTEDSNGDIKSYHFFYQDDYGNWSYVDEFIEVAIEQPYDGISFVKKYITKKTIYNYELDESTSQEEIRYVLYYNPNDLIKLITD